ncbi:MAG: carboxypeptidase M32 [Deltaproteobacteria bacterium]|nr:carboxypeptidase M32 [Deltaproteobacteria bacterium]MBW2069533.1 carboxypeptidase M32 [Deltaproteobacteria bacterium]
MRPEDAYKELLKWSRKLALLESIVEILEWDQRCYIPQKGNTYRAEQIGYVAKLRHEMMRKPEVGEWLAAAEGGAWCSDPLLDESVNLREWKRWHERATKVPSGLVEHIARVTSEAQTVWAKARENNDWKSFEPCMAEVFALKREEAEAIGYKEEPYDALLDQFEPGVTASLFASIAGRIKEDLQKLVDSVRDCGKQIDDSFLCRRFPIPIQEKFGTMVLKRLGYDFNAGRVDITVHPFTVLAGPSDVRITVRYDEHDFRVGFFSMVHEGGHALYDQGLDAEHWGTPRGMPVSLGVHESQSRFWENMVARSKGFWKFFYPRLLQHFPILADVSLDNFWRAVNKVAPSFIRVEADEVTYGLHIVLRFEIERDLLNGRILIRDVPDIWNQKMKEYLGIKPPDNKFGVLQDVHWSAGLIGYFPTYLLGNIYAAHLMEAISYQIALLDDLLERGQFFTILDWLRTRIHLLGCTYRPKELISQAIGQEIDPSLFVGYLKRKIAEVYGVVS